MPEQLSSQLLLKELRALTRERRLILDGSFLSFHPQPTGFPRSESQAALLDANFPPHLVVELVVPEERILERLSKRLVHAASGRIYNEDYNPPKTPGIDDLTGEELSRRVDDEPSAVRRRLVVYRHTESRVADHYSRRGILVRAEGECTDSIWPIIRDSVHASLRKFNL